MTESELKKIAASYAVAAGISPENLIDRIMSPHWEKSFGQWENLVPEELQPIWGRLTIQSRIAVFVVCAESLQNSLELME
jgi:hypothetical protein